MKESFEVNKANKVAVFLSLFYAFTTRTIVGPIIYRSFVPLVFYAVLYFSLIVCLLRSFKRTGRSLYAPREFFLVFTLFLIILFGLIKSEDTYSMLYFAIALLVPTAVYTQLKSSHKPILIFAVIGIVLFVGCFINYMFPIAYRLAILPIFSELTQQDLLWQASYGTAFPGFTSQVGYTAFFLSFSFGAVFCFRNSLFKKWFYPLAIVLLFGMFFTGKRGPFVFLVAACMIVYFIESHGKERVYRVFKIFLFAVFGYFALYLLATYTDNAGLQRIFDSIQEFVVSKNVEDEGRNQLWTQAIEYFRQNILTGIGWINYKNLFTLRHTHVHNIYLQLLCETGVIGFSCFVFFFIWALVRTAKHLKFADTSTYEYSWVLFSLFVQVYFLLYGFSGNPLYDVEEMILYFFAVGIGNLPAFCDIKEFEEGI